MARLFAIETSLCFAHSGEVVVSATFPAGFRLRWVPKSAKLAGNKRLGQDGSLNEHPRGVDTIQNGVRHAVSSKGDDSPIMAQTAYDHRVMELVRQLEDLTIDTLFSQSPRKTVQPANAMDCSFRAASFTALLPKVTTHELLLLLR